MPAPEGNVNAAKEGISKLVRIRLNSQADFDLVNEALTTEERGELLLAAACQAWSDALTIVADCARCGEAINATEARIYWDGQRICESCEQIALAARESAGHG